MENFRPISLLTYDYKILARILVNRMKPELETLLHPAQKCGVNGRSIFDVTCSVRDSIAYCHHNNTKSILVSLDFKRAFDNVSHSYLFESLKWHGFSEKFISYIKILYTDISAVLLINGFLTPGIAIKKSIRQGCPASMALFTLAINPLLYKLYNCVTGINIADNRFTVASYADDVTVMVASNQDLQNMWHTVFQFSDISGLQLNPEKSKALLVGKWNITPAIPHVHTVDNLTVLGITFTNKIETIQPKNWDPLVNKVKLLAKDMYFRDLCLYQRSWVIHQYILSQLWYKAQVIPLSKNHARQITSAILWYLWQGSIFKVPYSTLCLPPTSGGIGLINIELKCLSLFLGRNKLLQENQTNFTAVWFEFWHTQIDMRIPLDIRIIPTNFSYLKVFIQEWCYLDRTKLNTSSLNRHIYTQLLSGLPKVKMRIERHLNQNINISQIWKNIDIKGIPIHVKSVWYSIIHDILPSRERLHRIFMIETDKCPYCNNTETILHRVFECHILQAMWDQSTIYLQCLLPANHVWLYPYKLLWPDFCFSPHSKHKAVLWIIAHTLYYSFQNYGHVHKDDYIHYIKNAKHNLLRNSNTIDFARYLSHI